ncbi:HORMA domain-containing protein 1 [Entophlyctis sp. JEL0112]|nr:HORMA domain-containing protein 1 [Entophlyctis sp. JEL0112]
MQLKKFARNGAGEGDGGVSGWLETGCFDALDRQYLKTLVFGVYADAGLCSLCAVPTVPHPLLLSRINPPPLPRSSHTPRSIESYEFKFEYPSSDHIVLSMAAAGGQTPGRAVSMRGGSSGNSNSSSSKDGGGGARSKKECVKAMMAMLRRVVVMTQALKPITGATFVSIKLYYHDDITPHDYEPPNFRKGLAHEHDAHDTSGMDSFELGEMQTPHHKIGLTVVAVADMSDNSDGSDEDTQLPEDSLERPESGQAANNGTELSQVSNLTGVMEVLQERLDGGSKHGRLEAAIQEFKIEGTTTYHSVLFKNSRGRHSRRAGRTKWVKQQQGRGSVAAQFAYTFVEPMRSTDAFLFWFSAESDPLVKQEVVVRDSQLSRVNLQPTESQSTCGSNGGSQEVLGLPIRKDSCKRGMDATDRKEGQGSAWEASDDADEAQTQADSQELLFPSGRAHDKNKAARPRLKRVKMSIAVADTK